MGNRNSAAVSTGSESDSAYGHRGMAVRAAQRMSTGVQRGRIGPVQTRGSYGTAISAVYDTMGLDAMEAYPTLSMEYGGPITAMVRELGRTVMSHEMGLHTSAAKAMEEKAEPESMQTVEVVTQPQIQNQVVWQNPYMRSAPSEMTHHQKKNMQQKALQNQPQIHMSDAEIRRTADKVFKLVQEKIVQERRRIGRL